MISSTSPRRRWSSLSNSLSCWIDFSAASMLLANLSMGVVTSGGSTGAASAGGEAAGADGGCGTEGAPGALASGTTGMVGGCCANVARGNTIASAAKSAMSTRSTMFEAHAAFPPGVDRDGVGRDYPRKHAEDHGLKPQLRGGRSDTI